MLALLWALAAAAAAPARGAEEIPAEVLRRLQDPDPRVRGDGLKALRNRDDGAMAKAVVPLLDDEDPYCRDYACWMLLARSKDPEAIRWIVEKAPRAATAAGRLAAADALAALEDPAALAGLLRLCSDRDARVRETAVDGLGRRAKGDEPGAAGRAWAAVVDPAPGVRAAALEALARWKAPGAADYAERGLADADPGARSAAATILAGAAPERFAARFPSLAADPDWGVRFAAARGACLLAAGPPVEDLAALLDDPRMRVRDGAHDALRALSGLDLPPERKDWIDWWAGNREKWRGGSREGRGDAERPSTAVYHGLPFRSDAVLFLVDLSGSMDQPMGAVDRRSRFAVASEELARTLHALPDRASADLMTFMLEPARALGRIQELKGGTRDRVRRWLERQARGKRGDLGGALVAAIRDGEADTILFLGDGAASAGDCLFRERILERVRQALRLRPVALHAVAFGSRPQDRKFLEDLAAMAGGKCVER